MSHLRWICVIFLCCTSWYLNCSESRQGSEGFIWSQFELFNKKSQMKPQKGTLDRGFDWKPSDYPQDISPLRSFFQLSWLHLFSRRLLLCGQDTNSKYYVHSIGAIRPPEEFNYLFFFFFFSAWHKKSGLTIKLQKGMRQHWVMPNGSDFLP